MNKILDKEFALKQQDADYKKIQTMRKKTNSLWGLKGKFYCICMDCGKTVDRVNKDGECKGCTK